MVTSVSKKSSVDQSEIAGARLSENYKGGQEPQPTSDTVTNLDVKSERRS